MDTLRVNNRVLKLVRGDITELDIESFVYYARHDLALGSGFGGAIAQRGGPSVQEELKQFGTIKTTEVVISAAGDLKADYIIHAVGPRFQEENLERKLRQTIINVLVAAEQKKIIRVAFPPMGAGFYGIPLDLCAKIMTETIDEYLSRGTSFEEIVICVQDTRDEKPFRKYIPDTTPA